MCIRDRYYEILRIPVVAQSSNTLTQQRKGIKKIGRILQVFDSIEPASWPYSYSRIRKIMNRVSRELEQA